MAQNLKAVAQKLIQALNFEGFDLTYNTKQFKGKENRTLTMYWLGKNTWNSDTHRWENHEVYRTTSTIKLVSYLRDMWYLYHGRALPTDVPLWNAERSRLRDNGDKMYVDW